MKRQKSLKSLSLAAMLGFMAGLGRGEPPLDKLKTSKKKIQFDKDELAHLATLSGKNKKIYIKKLKEKYGR